jgi:hypothetical protein
LVAELALKNKVLKKSLLGTDTTLDVWCVVHRLRRWKSYTWWSILNFPSPGHWRKWLFLSWVCENFRKDNLIYSFTESNLHQPKFDRVRL